MATAVEWRFVVTALTRLNIAAIQSDDGRE